MIEKALIRNCVLAERDFGINSNEYTNAKNALSEYNKKAFEEYEKYLVDNMMVDIKDFPKKELVEIYLGVLKERLES